MGEGEGEREGARAMKRAGNDEGTQPRRKRAAMVRLNIGGLLFDTSRDTLSKCEYFGPFLAGRLCHAEDRNGRLFIDRPPPTTLKLTMICSVA